MKPYTPNAWQSRILAAVNKLSTVQLEDRDCVKPSAEAERAFDRLNQLVKNVGLNADWNCSAWQLDADLFLLDNEDHAGTVTLTRCTESERDGLSVEPLKVVYVRDVIALFDYVEMGPVMRDVAQRAGRLRRDGRG